MDTGWIVPAITAITGGTATVIGAIALYRKNSAGTSMLKFVLTTLVTWMEETDWPGEEGDKIIDRVPPRLYRSIVRVLGDEMGDDEDERTT